MGCFIVKMGEVIQIYFSSNWFMSVWKGTVNYLLLDRVLSFISGLYM